MTAALATAARVVLAAAGGVAFAAAFAAAVVWAGFGPQDGWMLAFLGAMCAVTVVAALGLYALQPKKAGDWAMDDDVGTCPVCGWTGPGRDAPFHECDQNWLKGAATWVPGMEADDG